LIFIDKFLLDILDNDNPIPNRRTTTIVSRSVGTRNEDSCIMSTTLTNNTHNQSYLASSMYSTVDSYHQSDNGFNDNNTEDFDSLEYQFSSYGPEAFKLFELFIKKLNNIKYLQYILHNWVIGNRLIIKYTNRIDNKDLIRALASVFRVTKQQKKLSNNIYIYLLFYLNSYFYLMVVFI